MKKKLSCALLIAAMLLGLLAGCGSSSNSSTAEEETAEETEETENTEEAEESGSEDTSETAAYTLPIVDEPVTYTMWMTYAPFAATLIDTDTLEGILVLDELQEVTNIYFDFVTVNGGAEEENYNLMIAAGDYTDILSSMSFYSTGLEGAVDDGIVMDLADILPEYCPTYWSYLSSNTNTLMRAYTDSGYMPQIMVLSPEVGQEVIGPILRSD